MRILYLITKSELGGAQTHVYQLMKDMTAQGHTVALMSYPGGWLEDRARELGVMFYPNTFFTSTFNPLYIIPAVATVARAVGDYRPDLVSCHSSSSGFFGRLAIRNTVPTVFTAHSWAFTDGAPLARKIVAIIAEKIVAPFTAAIICVSQFDYNLAIRYRIAPAKKLTVIHNGVESLTPKPTRKHPNITVVAVGRLAYPKRYDLLISAIAALDSATRDALSCTIIGDGPYRSTLKRNIVAANLEEIVTLAGAQPREQVMQVLSAADVFVLLSKHEGFPMTILEAMSVGLPVVASAVGGIPEAVDASCGILVHNDVDSIAHAITTMVQQKETRSAMGAAAREKVFAQFSVELFVAKTKAVYETVLTGAKTTV